MFLFFLICSFPITAFIHPTQARHARKVEMKKLNFKNIPKQVSVNGTALPYVQIGRIGCNQKLLHMKLEINTPEIMKIGNKAKKSYEKLKEDMKRQFSNNTVRDFSFINQSFWNDAGFEHDLQKMVTALGALSRINGLNSSNKAQHQHNRFKRMGDLRLDLHPGAVVKELFEGVNNILSLPTLKKVARDTQLQAVSLSRMNQSLAIIDNRLDTFDAQVAELFAHAWKSIMALEIRIDIQKRKMELRILIRDITTNVRNIIRSLPSLNKGIITHDLIPAEEVEQIFEILQTDANKHGQKLTVHKYMDLYLAKASFYITKDLVIRIIWSTTTVSATTTMDLYEWINVPIQFEDDYFKLTNVPTHIGLSNGLNQNRQAMEIWNIDDCKDDYHDGEYICNAKIPVLKNISDSCLASILASKTTVQCEADKLLEPIQPEYYWISTGMLALFLPERSPIYHKCDGEDGRKTFHQGIILQNIGESCSLETQRWKFLKTEKVVQAKYEIKQMQNFSHVFEAVEAEFEVPSKTNPEWNATHSPTFIPWNQDQEYLQHNDTMALTALIMAMISMILWAISVSYLVFKGRQIPYQVNPQQEQQQQLSLLRRILQCFCKFLCNCTKQNGQETQPQPQPILQGHHLLQQPLPQGHHPQQVAIGDQLIPNFEIVHQPPPAPQQQQPANAA